MTIGYLVAYFCAQENRVFPAVKPIWNTPLALPFKTHIVLLIESDLRSTDPEGNWDLWPARVSYSKCIWFIFFVACRTRQRFKMDKLDAYLAAWSDNLKRTEKGICDQTSSGWSGWWCNMTQWENACSQDERCLAKHWTFCCLWPLKHRFQSSYDYLLMMPWRLKWKWKCFD